MGSPGPMGPKGETGTQGADGLTVGYYLISCIFQSFKVRIVPSFLFFIFQYGEI